ncbi:MAG: hypothetical protein R3E10_17870 [Gemmatimonadota bacterium]
MSGARPALAGLLVIVAGVFTAGVSRIPWAGGNDQGRLRLSWRVVSSAAEVCRPPTEDEVAGLPAHMRPQRICETRASAHDLEVRLDGGRALSRTLEGSGARGDSPIYVFEEIALHPGPHDLHVIFTVDGDPSRTLELDTAVVVQRRETVLLTTDAAGVLVLRRDRSPTPATARTP